MVCAERFELPSSRSQGECLAHAFNVTLYPLSYEAKLWWTVSALNRSVILFAREASTPSTSTAHINVGGNGGSRIL